MKKGLKYYTEKFEYYSLHLLESINSIGYSFNGRKVDLVQDVYLSLLNRIGVNIASINHLSKVFHEENVSNSIALLFRACISDIIFGYYLIDYINDKESFDGEIRVKNVEFLKYIQKVGPKEQEILSKKTDKIQIDFNELIVNNFKDYVKEIDDNGKITFKNNSEIRKESKSKVVYLNNNLNFKLTEEYIFENLKNKDSKTADHFDSIYIFWKYYSQFQHFSHLGKVILYYKKENFLYDFMTSLLEAYHFISVIQRFVFDFSIEGYDQLKDELKQVYEEFKPDQLE